MGIKLYFTLYPKKGTNKDHKNAGEKQLHINRNKKNMTNTTFRVAPIKNIIGFFPFFFFSL